MRLKIALTGAGGTGKTTLAKELSEVLQVPFIPSPSRSCFEKHGILTEDDQNRMTAEQRLALQMDIFHAIDASVMSNKVGIFDRTHLDNFFYACHQCHGIIDNDTVDMMARQTYEGLRTFSHVFYAPIYPWTTIDDGMRTQSLAARTMCAAFVRYHLGMWQIDYDVLPNENVKWRALAIRHMLQAQRQNPLSFLAGV